MARLVRLMTRCMDVVDNDKLVTPSFRRDARYQRGNPEVAMQVFGTKFYQMHPFIFERLPAFFLASMNASVPNLTSSEYRPPKGISVSLQKDLGWI